MATSDEVLDVVAAGVAADLGMRSDETANGLRDRRLAAMGCAPVGAAQPCRQCGYDRYVGRSTCAWCGATGEQRTGRMARAVERKPTRTERRLVRAWCLLRRGNGKAVMFTNDANAAPRWVFQPTGRDWTAQSARSSWCPGYGGFRSLLAAVRWALTPRT